MKLKLRRSFLKHGNLHRLTLPCRSQRGQKYSESTSSRPIQTKRSTSLMQVFLPYQLHSYQRLETGSEHYYPLLDLLITRLENCNVFTSINFIIINYHYYADDETAQNSLVELQGASSGSLTADEENIAALEKCFLLPDSRNRKSSEDPKIILIKSSVSKMNNDGCRVSPVIEVFETNSRSKEFI